MLTVTRMRKRRSLEDDCLEKRAPTAGLDTSRSQLRSRDTHRKPPMARNARRPQNRAPSPAPGGRLNGVPQTNPTAIEPPPAAPHPTVPYCALNDSVFVSIHHKRFSRFSTSPGLSVAFSMPRMRLWFWMSWVQIPPAPPQNYVPTLVQSHSNRCKSECPRFESTKNQEWARSQ